MAADPVENYKQYRQLITQLKEQRRQGWETHWRDLIQYLMPRRGRLKSENQNTQANRGDKDMASILDATACQDLNTLAAGMMTGITSPARTWFQLATPDDDLNEWAPVKRWLEEASEREANLFRGSNLYNVLPEAWTDIGGLGTCAVGFQEDDDDVFRFTHHPIGTYWLANNARGVVDTCVREYAMTVGQMVQAFGVDALSRDTRAAYDRGHLQTWVDVLQVIQPNAAYSPKKLGGKAKRFISCHFEAVCSEDKVLKESGFDDFPMLVGRWSVAGENVYGDGPGFMVLPAVKELQLLKRRKAQAVDKGVSPPWLVPADLELDLRPGAMNPYSKNAVTGNQPVIPLFQAGMFPYAEVRQDIADVKQEIHRGLFADLFLMLTMDTRAQPPTAAEIYARQEEKMMVLGPALERLNDEFLDPLVGRGFSIMAKRGLLPQAPRELMGKPLTVRYVSVMAQAQKLAGLGAQERFIGHVTMLGQFRPEVLDTVDWDREVAMYADKVGASARLVRSPQELDAIRKQRAQAQAMQASIANAQGAAMAAKNLAAAKTGSGEDNALTQLQQLAGRPLGG